MQTDTLNQVMYTFAATIIVGILGSLAQKAVTRWPRVTWLTPLSSRLTKISVSAIVPVVAAAVTAYATHDWRPMAVALVTAWGIGQGNHNVTKPAQSP